MITLLYTHIIIYIYNYIYFIFIVTILFCIGMNVYFILRILFFRILK